MHNRKMWSKGHETEDLEIPLKKNILAFGKQGKPGESDSMPQEGALGLEL